MVALWVTLLLQVEASKAIEIEFPNELQLSATPKPALLRARWVQGPLGADVDGPMLWPWVSQGRVERWRRLPGSMSFEGVWHPPTQVEPGTFLIVVSTDARGKLDWTALAVEIETAPGQKLRTMRHDRLGLVCPRGTLSPGETVMLQSATDRRVTGAITWSATAGHVAQDATVARYTAPTQNETSQNATVELRVTAVSESAGTASCLFTIGTIGAAEGGPKVIYVGGPASAPTK